MARSAVTNRVLLRDFGTCLKFNKVNTEYVDLGASSKSALSFIQNTAVFSMGCWVKLASFGPQFALAGNNATSVTEKGFIFSISNNGSLRIQLTDGSQATINAGLVSTAPFTVNDIGRWVFVAVTCNGTSPTGYIIRNGTVSSQTSGTVIGLSSGDSTFNITLGVCNGASRAVPLDGLMDEFFIENYEMTSAQIQAVAARTAFPNDTVRHRWKFDEGSGTTANDSGTSPLTGTLTGTVTYSTDVAFKPRVISYNRVPASGRITS